MVSSSFSFSHNVFKGRVTLDCVMKSQTAKETPKFPTTTTKLSIAISSLSFIDGKSQCMILQVCLHRVDFSPLDFHHFFLSAFLLFPLIYRIMRARKGERETGSTQALTQRQRQGE